MKKIILYGALCCFCNTSFSMQSLQQMQQNQQICINDIKNDIEIFYTTYMAPLIQKKKIIFKNPIHNNPQDPITAVFIKLMSLYALSNMCTINKEFLIHILPNCYKITEEGVIKVYSNYIENNNITSNNQYNLAHFYFFGLLGEMIIKDFFNLNYYIDVESEWLQKLTLELQKQDFIELFNQWQKLNDGCNISQCLMLWGFQNGAYPLKKFDTQKCTFAIMSENFINCFLNLTPNAFDNLSKITFYPIFELPNVLKEYFINNNIKVEQINKFNIENQFFQDQSLESLNNTQNIIGFFETNCKQDYFKTFFNTQITGNEFGYVDCKKCQIPLWVFYGGVYNILNAIGLTNNTQFFNNFKLIKTQEKFLESENISNIWINEYKKSLLSQSITFLPTPSNVLNTYKFLHFLSLFDPNFNINNFVNYFNYYAKQQNDYFQSPLDQINEIIKVILYGFNILRTNYSQDDAIKIDFYKKQINNLIKNNNMVYIKDKNHFSNTIQSFLESLQKIKINNDNLRKNFSKNIESVLSHYGYQNNAANTTFMSLNIRDDLAFNSNNYFKNNKEQAELLNKITKNQIVEFLNKDTINELQKAQKLPNTVLDNFENIQQLFSIIFGSKQDNNHNQKILDTLHKSISLLNLVLENLKNDNNEFINIQDVKNIDPEVEIRQQIEKTFTYENYYNNTCEYILSLSYEEQDVIKKILFALAHAAFHFGNNNFKIQLLLSKNKNKQLIVESLENANDNTLINSTIEELNKTVNFLNSKHNANLIIFTQEEVKVLLPIITHFQAIIGGLIAASRLKTNVSYENYHITDFQEIASLISKIPEAIKEKFLKFYNETEKYYYDKENVWLKTIIPQNLLEKNDTQDQYNETKNFIEAILNFSINSGPNQSTSLENQTDTYSKDTDFNTYMKKKPFNTIVDKKLEQIIKFLLNNKINYYSYNQDYTKILSHLPFLNLLQNIKNSALDFNTAEKDLILYIPQFNIELKNDQKNEQYNKFCQQYNLLKTYNYNTNLNPYSDLILLQNQQKQDINYNCEILVCLDKLTALIITLKCILSGRTMIYVKNDKKKITTGGESNFSNLSNQLLNLQDDLNILKYQRIKINQENSNNKKFLLEKTQELIKEKEKENVNNKKTPQENLINILKKLFENNHLENDLYFNNYNNNIIRYSKNNTSQCVLHNQISRILETQEVVIPNGNAIEKKLKIIEAALTT